MRIIVPRSGSSVRRLSWEDVVGVDRPQKTAMLIARNIVGRISRDGLAVGDRLQPERVMLEEFGVGRGTLRESLRFLELQGVISLKPGPGGGPIIEKPDAANLATTLVLLMQFENAHFRSIVEARQGLEPLMASLASERMTDDQLAELEGTVVRMGDNLDNIETFLETNKRFHDVIAWASGNSLYGFLVDALLGIMDGTALGVDYPKHRRSAILKAHTKIYEALAKHDRSLSEESMANHIREMQRYLERKFPAAMDQPITWDLIT